VGRKGFDYVCGGKGVDVEKYELFDSANTRHDIEGLPYRDCFEIYDEILEKIKAQRRIAWINRLCISH